MPKGKTRNRNGRRLPPLIRSAAGEAFHQRFLYLFDESVGKLLRENPDVEERVTELTAEIFEMIAAGLRKQVRRPRHA